MQNLGNAFRLPVSGGHLQPDQPAEDVRRGVPLFTHLDAELGSQVGDDGGGSADNKGWRFGDLEIWRFAERSPLARG